MELRIIEGFVCVARLKENPNSLGIFGKPTNPKYEEQEHESIESNGLIPYETVDEARSAKTKIEKRADFGLVWIGRLKMTAAESKEEDTDPLFQNSNSMVIIIQHERGIISIFGPALPNRQQSINETCSPFWFSDFRTFASYEAVKWPLSEAKRLSWQQCFLATFSLERVAD